MLIWFLVAAPIIVAEVFRSPRVDYRLVALGAALPLVEWLIGGPSVGHTLLGSVVALAVVMAVTVGRRLVRRRLLGVPIGLFLHLVLDGTWTRADLFWWPALGSDLGALSVPEADRWPPLAVGLELAGIGLGVWAWRRYDLGAPANRSLLIRHGHLAREAL